MEVAVGFGADHSTRVGISGCVIPYGKGQIVLMTLPQEVRSLGEGDFAMSRVVATLSDSRNNVIRSKTDGKTEKSSGCVAASVISISKMVSARLKASRMSSNGVGSGTSKTTNTPRSANDSTSSLR